MTEMAGWGDFISALNNLEGHGGGGSGGSGSGGGSGGGGDTSISIDASHLTAAQSQALFNAGFRGNPNDRQERFYGTTSQWNSLSDNTRFGIVDSGTSPTTPGGYVMAEDASYVPQSFYR